MAFVRGGRDWNVTPYVVGNVSAGRWTGALAGVGLSGEHGQARRGAVWVGQDDGTDAQADASSASLGAMAVSAYGGVHVTQMVGMVRLAL